MLTFSPFRNGVLTSQHLCHLTSLARTRGPHKYGNMPTCSHTLRHVTLDQVAPVAAGTNTRPTTAKCTTALVNALMHVPRLYGYNLPLPLTHTHALTHKSICMDWSLQALRCCSCPPPTQTHQFPNQTPHPDSFTPYSVQQPGTDKSKWTDRID